MKLTRKQLRLIIEEATLQLSDDDVKAAETAVDAAADPDQEFEEADVVKAYVDQKTQTESITLMKKPMHSHDSVSIVDFMGRPDHEGKMAYKQLKRTSSMSQSLCHRLEDKENIQLPAWVQSKITKAADYIQSVYNYLDEDLD